MCPGPFWQRLCEVDIRGQEMGSAVGIHHREQADSPISWRRRLQQSFTACRYGCFHLSWLFFSPALHFLLMKLLGSSNHAWQVSKYQFLRSLMQIGSRAKKKVHDVSFYPLPPRRSQTGSPLEWHICRYMALWKSSATGFEVPSISLSMGVTQTVVRNCGHWTFLFGRFSAFMRK